MTNKLMLMLMSGPSGCGKSTFAKQLAESTGALICSADSYFLDANGDYKFDRSRLGAAHSNCYNTCVEELMASKSVIVDNTNTTWKEISKYAELANKYKVSLYIYRPKSINSNLFAGRNVHQVPKDIVEGMVNRFITVETLDENLRREFPNLIFCVTYFENI